MPLRIIVRVSAPRSVIMQFSRCIRGCNVHIYTGCPIADFRATPNLNLALNFERKSLNFLKSDHRIVGDGLSVSGASVTSGINEKPLRRLFNRKCRYKWRFGTPGVRVVDHPVHFILLSITEEAPAGFGASIIALEKTRIPRRAENAQGIHVHTARTLFFT